MKNTAWVLTLLALSPFVVGGSFSRSSPAAEPDAAGIEFFESKVRPILVEHCQECHGAKKQESELRVDSKAALAAGGASGPTIVPNDPDKSLLIQAVRWPDIGLQMPPKAKLPNDKIAILVEWVKRGAPYPGSEGAPAPTKSVGDEAVAAGRQFWSFQPPRAAPLPVVRDAAWVRAPVDAFLLATMERHELSPAPPADRATLLRRLTFDFTGLPPTPDEVLAFLADDSPDAVERQIDRLLASPRYGERWGRHWLDVARYSDSNGLDENVAHGNAWRYRDYVVSAFNHDKPYDEFLREQLAGDLLAAQTAADSPTSPRRHEQLIATGFLALGPKVLAEVDERKMEMDIVDEQIDTFGRAVLGLTLGCARCHDHKFDPIALKDYYALAGVFKSTRTMEHFKKVARWYENPIPSADELARQAAHRDQVAAKKKEIDDFLASAKQKLLDGLKPGETPPANPEAQFDEATKTQLKKLRDETAKLEKSAPETATAMGATEGTATDVPVHVRGSHLTLGQVVPRGVPRVLISNDSHRWQPQGSGRMQMVDWLTAADHPLTARVYVNRVWRWHFGRGLVRSTDNFGRLGEPPTHPELLDTLAVRFATGGWSTKRLHRELASSSFYAQSSDYDTKKVEADPDNQWWSRQDVRRLEAEAVRDSLLAVSGRLDESLGGSLLHVKNRDYFFDHTSKDGTKYDSPRRSIYLPVVRNNMFDVFQLYDYADSSVPFGNRESTVVAPQALFLLNSPLALEASAGLAAETLAAPLAGDAPSADDARIRSLSLRCYGRPASDPEVSRAREFLETLTTRVGGDRKQAWARLAQVYLASSEFIYLR